MSATRARVAAAAAASLTVLLLQATLVGPVTTPFDVSLPAILVAAVALVDGPATGMTFGFALGLAADLGSRHPAGLFALCWLAVGLLAGMIGDRRSLRRDATTIGVLCGLASGLGTALLALLGDGGTLTGAAQDLLPVAALSALLGAAVLPLTRRMLHAERLRAPHPVYTELAMGPGRAR